MGARVTWPGVKRFQMITEADARAIEYGGTVSLAAGGHVTPLAQDTLRARRVTVVRENAEPDDGLLVPVAEIRRIVVAGDHAAPALKRKILEHLRGRGLAAEDLGTHGTDPVDYPDTAAAAARCVARGEADAAIVIDGAGLGSAIAANKVRGIRAAACPTVLLARYARQHNGANVLALGAALVSAGEALAIVDAFLDTPMREARYIRRLAKIRDLELEQGRS